jgi:hypothetical protein
LSLEELVLLLGEDLPAVVFSDDPITKMHASLPMVLFHFESLVKLSEAGEMGFLYLFDGVLESLS